MTTPRRFVHFHGVGAAGALVNLGALYLAHDVAGLHLYASLVASFTVAVGFNFCVIKAWTFRDTRWELGYSMLQFLNFYAIASVGLCLNLGLFYALHELIALGVYAAQAIAIAASAPFHFFLNQWITFRRCR